MAQQLAESNLGFKLTNENLKEIAFVRKVANNKYMMRIDLILTHDILQGTISNQKRSNDSIDENPCKKKCNLDKVDVKLVIHFIYLI